MATEPLGRRIAREQPFPGFGFFFAA